jgi:hypothetical protein
LPDCLKGTRAAPSRHAQDDSSVADTVRVCRCQLWNAVKYPQVRDLLGHASITTTERYDNQKLENLQAAAARPERGETFDPAPQDPVAPSIRQDFVKNPADDEADDHIDRVRETSPIYGDDLNLADWPGVRDDFRNWLIRAA